MSLYRAYRLFIPVVALLLVTACGVKPGTLFSPSEWASANEAASEEVVEPVKKAALIRRRRLLLLITTCRRSKNNILHS